MNEEIISLGDNQFSPLNTNICVQMNCLCCASLLCFFLLVLQERVGDQDVVNTLPF